MPQCRVPKARVLHPSSSEEKKDREEKKKETNVERVTEGKDERFYLHSFYRMKLLLSSDY